jgi:hypothetical protein
MKTNVSFWILMIMVMSLVMFACTDSSTPDTATIHGTITFKNFSSWKASGTHTIADVDSGVVEVTIFGDSIWTLSNGVRAPINAPFNSQNPFVINRIAGDSIYEYSIDVDPGTYSALAVGFRTNRSYSATKKTATLGVYWNHPDSVSSGLYIPSALNDPAPSPITVAKGDNVQLDFKANFGFVTTWFYGIVPYIP